MAETKKDKTKWIDAVTSMIELTQQGKMRWNAVEPAGTVAEEKNRTSAVFRTIYDGKALILYERKVPERRLVTEREGGNALLNWLEPKYQTVWIPEVVLEFVDSSGATLWSFPKVSALLDLLTAVQYQATGVNEFIDKLLSETNVPQ